MAPKAPNRRPVPPKAAKASKEKRKQDTLRRAKAVIQRRTVATATDCPLQFIL